MDVSHKIGNTVSGIHNIKQDSGVAISADLKVSKQCGIAGSKGNQFLGLKRRNITNKRL